ncbi:3-phosphoshikimate 1-carboxyvinyltransferase [Papillibacter cinnamivorans]|uniref:3-phosphoshikimate 1-carboxyvinyltransferase n=1 Tax=Papillibacter cinnamivorans DSM 12816 TaxID=1122930 RepID=A0A1W2BUT5_9FIRM|nr:3-phosphoshikimate 1-carboxyvinyltransferase [Papillibacter cinnamivorans]SMC76669.1 3-phosphoshikimate 1-carboxyvinyltransferase [Papillibacter cinnamivorans DSM 12816]
MTVFITPARLHGTVKPPPSKSQAHRALLAAALARGTSRIQNVDPSEDILATMGAVQSLGISCRKDGKTVTVGELRMKRDLAAPIDCGESGSTLRFLIPIALALFGAGRFTGRGRLMRRPQEPYFEIFRERGIRYDLQGDLLWAEGELKSGVFRLPGDVSSQFVTGLLFALPLLKGDSVIEVTSPLESRGYVDMTLDTLAGFGIRADNRGYESFFIPGGQSYRPREMTVESDYSQAAFFLAANVMGNRIEVSGLNPDSIQGDRVILELAGRMTTPGDLEIDVSQCPDLVPALAAAAALRRGWTTSLTGAGRLRLKESDRLEAVSAELSALGAEIEAGEDFLKIHGVENLRGGSTDSRGDHRIAMALAVAATRASGEVTVTGAEAVRKSYPDFWEDYRMLGGNIR